VTDILLIVTLILLVAAVALLLMLLRKASQADALVLASRLDAFEKAQERTERAVREEVSQSRDELGKAAREQRQELTEAFKTFGDSVVQRMMDVANMQKGQLDAFSGQLGSFAKASGERLDGVRTESATGAKQLREEVVGTLKALSETITQTMGELANVQKGQLDAFSGQLASFAKASGEKLDGVRVESATGAKQLREEVVTTLKSISETMSKTMKDLAVAEKAQLEAFSGQIASLTKTSGEKLDGIRTESATGAKQLREEVIAALKGITEATTKTMGELANLQKTQLEAMSSAIGKLSDSNEKKLEAAGSRWKVNSKACRLITPSSLNKCGRP